MRHPQSPIRNSQFAILSSLFSFFHFFIFSFLILSPQLSDAQQRNVINIPDAEVQIGQVQIPIAIENTEPVVAAQFDITLPPECRAVPPLGVLTGRATDHNVIVRNMDDTRYRVMIYSPTGATLRGQQGNVMHMPITIPTTATEGTHLPILISNATLSSATGENVLNQATAGELIVAKLPDITPTTLTCDATTITPGDNIVVRWHVHNVGAKATNAGWSEQLFLADQHGTTHKLIATTFYNETLDPGEHVQRQAEITLPKLLGIDGQARLMLRLQPDADTGESNSAQGNNTITTNPTFDVTRKLFLDLSTYHINEGCRAVPPLGILTQPVTVKLSRSGDWSSEQTFTITHTPDSRVCLPEYITIPAGQAGAVVNMTIADNNLLDDASTININVSDNTSDPQRAYPSAQTTIVIEDDEQPDLNITASATEITEGHTITLTIAASRPPTTDLDIALSAEWPKRFTLPTTVVLPAGQTSIDVNVTAIDDNLPDIETSSTFTAQAPAYNRAETIVVLHDNDMPQIQLQLLPPAIAENAGPQAVTGVLM